MQTIVGNGWTMDYTIENGKLTGVKFHGKAKDMKEAMTRINEIVAQVAIEAA